jgi:hypothetical protein
MVREDRTKTTNHDRYGSCPTNLSHDHDTSPQTMTTNDRYGSCRHEPQPWPQNINQITIIEQEDSLCFLISFSQINSRQMRTQ